MSTYMDINERYGRRSSLSLFVLVQAVSYMFSYHIVGAYFLPVGMVLSVLLLKLSGYGWGWWLSGAIFVPAMQLLLILDLPAWSYLLAFCLIWLFFGHVGKDRVPFFLSTQPVVEHLLSVLKDVAPRRVQDLGCASGGVLRSIAEAMPEVQCVGIEQAWFPALMARFRLRIFRQTRVVRGSFWNIDLSDTDVAYVYLSPKPMAELWQKACSEMRAGALLVSNSFSIPGVIPERIIEVPDLLASRLYIYRIPARSA